MRILDTEAISLIQRGSGSRFESLADLLDTAHVDYSGRPMLDYDEKAEAILDRLKGMKSRPATNDLRIAPIALLHDAVLVTGNVKDFAKIPLLKLQPIS